MYGWIRDISRAKSTDLALHAEKEPSNIDNKLTNVIPTRNGDPVRKDFPEWI